MDAAAAATSATGHNSGAHAAADAGTGACDADARIGDEAAMIQAAAAAASSSTSQLVLQVQLLAQRVLHLETEVERLNDVAAWGGIIGWAAACSYLLLLLVVLVQCVK